MSTYCNYFISNGGMAIKVNKTEGINCSRKTGIGNSSEKDCFKIKGAENGLKNLGLCANQFKYIQNYTIPYMVKRMKLHINYYLFCERCA